MIQIVEQTHEEKVAMYMKLSKKELIEMLIQANLVLESRSSYIGSYSIPDKVPYGSICSCNPANGGSGICGCIMGNQMVDNPAKYGSPVIQSQTTTNLTITKPMSKESLEDFKYIKARIKQEGFHYCFVHYSDFEDINDAEFHKKRVDCLKAMSDLTNYINDKIEKLEKLENE